MTSSRTLLTGALLTALLAMRGSAWAGPFAGEFDGIPATTLPVRDWISAVISYEPSSTPGSGGAARDDAALSTSISNAVVGRPGDFSLGGMTRHYVSLGNGGRITVAFEHPISNGAGADFAVFENGFRDETDWTGTTREGATNNFFFAELATVEVSSDLQHWARFPITTLNTELLFVATYAEEHRYASQDVTGLDGFAGKHDLSVGTPFDLDALTNHPAVKAGQINLALIRYIRLTDVVGDGSVLDDAGRPIYDPYYDYFSAEPTPYAPQTIDGFDLRGIAALHTGEANIARDSGGPAMLLDGVDHTVYQLQQASDVRASDWSVVGTVTGRGERILWPLGLNPRGFFRVLRGEEAP